MDGLVDLITASHAKWMPLIVEAVLGTNDPVSVAETLTDAVAAALSMPVAGARFYEPGVGIVAGLVLADGRQVVAKVHWWQVSAARLAAIHRVQAAAADAGLPAPRPLAGPVVLGTGWLTVEELCEGDPADGYDPAVRRSMAEQLHRFVVATAPHAEAAIGSWMLPAVHDGVWPQPHDRRFDFAATTAGAGWIDDAGRQVRAELERANATPTVGHLDWRAQNLAFAGSDVVAIYDWDSVGLIPEPVLAGVTSVQQPLDWRRELPDPLPTLEQLDGFVADYEAARGTPFTPGERALVDAGQRWLTSYGARCQHADDLLGHFPNVDHTRGWPRLLRELLGRQ